MQLIIASGDVTKDPAISLLTINLPTSSMVERAHSSCRYLVPESETNYSEKTDDDKKVMSLQMVSVYTEVDCELHCELDCIVNWNFLLLCSILYGGRDILRQFLVQAKGP